jgi:hypothetical protein
LKRLGNGGPPAISPASPFPHPAKPPSQTHKLTELIYMIWQIPWIPFWYVRCKWTLFGTSISNYWKLYLRTIDFHFPKKLAELKCTTLQVLLCWKDKKMNQKGHIWKQANFV